MGTRPPLDERKHQNVEVSTSSAPEIDAFLKKAAVLSPVSGTQGRLVFALDATMSRQPTWDAACHIQSEMFQAVEGAGGLSIKLVYFRGFDECRASRWFSNPGDLAGVMSRIRCQGGRTQIRKVLSAALSANDESRIAALVYVGDSMEEDVDLLCQRAGELGLKGVPVFLFQEGRDPVAAEAFREIARISGGAYCAFTSGSAADLASLLKAIAVYASGGKSALAQLEAQGDGGARLLLQQMK
ncbi:VWA domain-containing protein [Roseibium litorale]|uniref:VWA domain-containing protein n=1 Tax=Roseibium litorale TaxID=2803841 RepID=A0ABR9CH80_9HYPH|nr:VWA domain-containing protein [Roseibium litorale]MBD8890113.1 VWA domain-containing protein [Roseibium litorale]